MFMCFVVVTHWLSNHTGSPQDVMFLSIITHVTTQLSTSGRWRVYVGWHKIQHSGTDFIAARSEFVEILSEALLSADIIDKVRTSDVYDTLRSCSSPARMHQDSRNVPSTVYFTLVLGYHPVLCNARIGKIMSNTVAAFERPLRFLYKAPVRCRVAYRNGSPSLFVRLRACSRISTPDEVLKWSF